jgi:hypothetical protein
MSSPGSGRRAYGLLVRRLVALVAFLALLASAGDAAAQADPASGRPGRLLAVAPVVGSHYNPCAPGGLQFDFPPAGYPCWQAWLGSAASPTVGRSPALRRRAPLVTLTRRIYRGWLPTDQFVLAVQRSITLRIGRRTRAVRFPAWSEVTSAGFGYQTVIYTLVWRSAASGAMLGSRSHAVQRYVCQTHFPCTPGWRWVWLSDTD